MAISEEEEAKLEMFLDWLQVGSLCFPGKTTEFSDSLFGTPYLLLLTCHLFLYLMGFDLCLMNLR